MRKTSTQGGLELGTALAAVVGILACGAGILHLLASRDHLEHAPIAASFVLLGLAQFAWGALVAWRRSPRVLALGALGSLAVVAVWVLSRTMGIPIMDAISQAEPIGIADATATFFELMAAAGAGMLLVLPAAALTSHLARARAQRFVASSGAIALLLTVPAFVVPSHSHGEGGGEGLSSTHAHGAGDLATAADDHLHDVTAVNDVAHTDMNGHPHGEAPGPETTTETAAAPSHAHDGTVAAAARPHAKDAQHEHGQTPPAAEDTSQTSAAPPMPKPRGKVTTMRYGPFVLPAAANGGNDHRNQILPAILPPCVNCLVTSMTPDLVYADGSPANMDTGPMLHHSVLFDTLTNDPTCGRGDSTVGFIGHRVFAAGNERTPMILPEGYAVPIASPWWAGVFEIMNDAPSVNVVFFELTVTYLPGADTSVKPVTPVWLDVDNCGDSQFAIPKGESVTKWKWTSNITGRIVAAGGHVHDGGISITLSNATRGDRMCTSLAGYGTKPAYMGSVESMSICPYDRIGVVKAGEDLQLDTYYNSMAAAPDVMGIMIAYVYETDDLSGGSAPPAAYTAPPPNDAPPPQSHAHGH